MIVDFHDSDRMLGIKAVGIYRKGIESAITACDKVYVSTLALQTADSEAESSGDWLATSLEEMGIGEVRELTMPGTLALALRTAVSCYLSQLTKLAEKQADLLVPLEDTNELTSRLQSLADRLAGQMELAGVNTVSFSANGSDPVTVTADDLSNAVRHLK